MSSSTALPILTRLFDEAPATAKSVGTDAIRLGRLEQDSLVRRVGEVRTGKRGRPAIKWALTDKARKRVKRARASQGC